MFAFPTHTVPIIIVPNTTTALEIKYVKVARLFHILPRVPRIDQPTRNSTVDRSRHLMAQFPTE